MSVPAKTPSFSPAEKRCMLPQTHHAHLYLVPNFVSERATRHCDKTQRGDMYAWEAAEHRFSHGAQVQAELVPQDTVTTHMLYHGHIL